MKKVKGAPFQSFRDELLQSPEAKAAYEEAQREYRTQLREPTTVGEMLYEEFLKPLNITQQQLADAMGVSRKVVGQILKNQRRLSIAEAVLLSQLFEMGESFWLNLQAAHDRWEGRYSLAQLIEGVTPENQHPPIEWGPDVGGEILPDEHWITLPDGRIIGIPDLLPVD